MQRLTLLSYAYVLTSPRLSSLPDWLFAKRMILKRTPEPPLLCLYDAEGQNQTETDDAGYS